MSPTPVLMQNRHLYRYLREVRRQLEQFADITDLAAHGDVKGAPREGFVKAFLKNHLPSSIDYGTGEIVDADDNRSGQIDIILQSAISPRMTLLESVMLAFADAVLGIIEVKSTLTTASWSESSHLRS